MALIEVENLSFEYPGKRALDDVSFAIEAGTVTALVGPNGAGKTTLMNCLAALSQPLSGVIRLAGIEVLEEPRKCHREIGYLPDFFGLYKDLTVEQCLRFMALAQDIEPSKVETVVRATAQKLNLTSRLHSKAGELSRGWRQRLAIGQAIIHEPPVLLLDEPASGLDPEARHHLSRLILRLRDEGKTLLVSSHILSELEDYSSHMMVIKDGKIAEHIDLGKPQARAEQWIQIKLSREVDNLSDRLQALEGIGEIRPNKNHVEFSFSGDAGQQHALLKELLDAGLPVCAFAEMDRNLQETYLQKFGEEHNAS